MHPNTWSTGSTWCVILALFALNVVYCTTPHWSTNPHFLPLYPSQEWSQAHGGDLPTVEELSDVWNVGAKVEEPGPVAEDASSTEKTKHTKKKKAHKAHKRKCDILIWYLDSFLPMVVGVDFWGPNIRLCNLPIDTFEVSNGKKKVCVSKAGEAFALVQFENSRERWINIFKWKKANPGKKNPPQYSKKRPETHECKSKWSDYAHGQGSGWDPEAFGVHNQRLKEVKALREEEDKDGYPKMNFGNKLLGKFLDIPVNQDGPVSEKQRAQEVEVQHAAEDDVTVIN